MRNQKQVLLIIPAYNEERNIERTVEQILQYPKQADFL